jgi:hypothetical protein
LEQFLEPRAVFCMPQQALCSGFLEIFFELASDYKEASLNFDFTFLHKKAAKKFRNQQRS